MLFNIFLIFLFVFLTAFNSQASSRSKVREIAGAFDELAIEFKGITPEKLPKDYSLEDLRKDSFTIDLSFIRQKYPVSAATVNEWKTKSLVSKKCIIFHAIDFLEFDINRLLDEYSDFFVKPSNSEVLTDEKAYFNTLWDKGVLSVSLVCADAPFVAGKYGLILEVPPQLILRTYTSDAVTPRPGSYFRNDYEAINEFLEKSIINGYAGNNPHAYDKQLHTILPLEELRRITKDKEMYNEIVIAPRGRLNGKLFEIKLIGFLINDPSMKQEFSIPSGHPKDEPFPGKPKYSNAETVRKIKEISLRLNLPILSLSNLNEDINLLQPISEVSDEHDIHQRKLVVNPKKNPNSMSVDQLLSQHQALKMLAHLEVALQHPAAHNTDVKSTQIQINEIKKELGGNAEELLKQYQALEMLAHLEVALQHPAAHNTDVKNVQSQIDGIKSELSKQNPVKKG
jgi:hypothetical protein